MLAKVVTFVNPPLFFGVVCILFTRTVRVSRSKNIEDVKIDFKVRVGFKELLKTVFLFHKNQKIHKEWSMVRNM